MAQGNNAGKGMWPPVPVSVSNTEAIVEVFWDPAYMAASRWTLGPVGVDAQLVPSWDQTMIAWKPRAAGETLELQRPYDLDVSGYRRLVLRVRTNPDVSTMLTAVVDATSFTIVRDIPGKFSTCEMAGEFQGSHLEQVKVVFTASRPGSFTFELRWVMVDKPGMSWNPPSDLFNGMIVEEPVKQFEPGIGLLSSVAGIEQMRRVFHSPAYAAVAGVDCSLAARQALIDPASLIRRFVLYARGRYDRESDADRDFNNDGLTLAYVGLLTKNEEYLRLAAKHAIVFALTEHWSEGFVDRFPAPPPEFNDQRCPQPWRHSAFAPNVTSIQVSLLLDMAWHWLTPAGRHVLLTALREKGIPFFAPFLPPVYGGNQAARFTKGYLLARMATAPSISDPVLQAEMRVLLRDFNACVSSQTREDGTFFEEGYGQSVIENIAGTYHAFSRCLQHQISDLVPLRVIKSMRFILDSQRAVSPHLAAFGAGPLGDALFSAHCAPAHLTAGWNPENHGYGLESAWCSESRALQQMQTATPFSVYKEGGWVFMGNSDPALTRVSLESGFWATEGHIWKHKNTVTLDAFGETLLLTRQYAGYADVRFETTARAAAYNTFTPGERDMDLNPSGANGATLLLARDLGPAAVAASDAASAWQKGVRKALRRVILFRPNVLIIEDTAEFDVDEPGIQSWNSLGEWKISGNTLCELRVGKARARMTVITPRNAQIRVEEDSIHLEALSDSERVRTGTIYRERTVNRAAFISPAAKQHRILTVIQAFDDAMKYPAGTVTVIREFPLVIEIGQGNRTARIADGQASVKDLWGCEEKGDLVLVIREHDTIIAAHAL